MTYAKIVWDGQKLSVPCEMGCASANQLQGTDLDNLTELAGRVCYDSLGTGRDSVNYHKHVIEVNHTSIQEHANLTFAISLDIPNYLACIESLSNRPGVWTCKEETASGFNLRITANIRSIREWFEFPVLNKMSLLLGQKIQFLSKGKASLSFQDMEIKDIDIPLTLVEPKYEDEKWVSIYFTNVSRGFSHELVRHKFRTAVSQRSTRFVDEEGSKWCWHPLILKHIDLDEKILNNVFSLNEVRNVCRNGYKEIVAILQNKLIQEGVDKFTARKQARGAARGILGNALETDLVFSASIFEWKWIFKSRCVGGADAEIRVATNEVFELLSERFPENFQGYTKKPCSDGIGFELIEPNV